MDLQKTVVDHPIFEIWTFKGEYPIYAHIDEKPEEQIELGFVINGCLNILSGKRKESSYVFGQNVYQPVVLSHKEVCIKEFCFIKIKQNEWFDSKKYLTVAKEYGFTKTDWHCLLGLLKHPAFLKKHFKNSGITTFSEISTHLEKEYDYQYASNPYKEIAPHWENTVMDYPMITIKNDNRLEMNLRSWLNPANWVVIFK